MANHCYNAISITGNSKELNELYKWLTKDEDYIDFQHVLNREKQITCGEIFSLVGTKWFVPDIEMLDGIIILNGDSTWSPPVALFVNLVKIFPSLNVNT